VTDYSPGPYIDYLSSLYISGEQSCTQTPTWPACQTVDFALRLPPQKAIQPSNLVMASPSPLMSTMNCDASGDDRDEFSRNDSAAVEELLKDDDAPENIPVMTREEFERISKTLAPQDQAACNGTWQYDRQVLRNTSTEHHVQGENHLKCMINNPAWNSVSEGCSGDCSDTEGCESCGHYIHGTRHRINIKFRCNANPYYNANNVAFGPRCVPDVAKDNPDVTKFGMAGKHKHRWQWCRASCAFADTGNGTNGAVGSCKVQPEDKFKKNASSTFPIPGMGGGIIDRVTTRWMVGAAAGMGAMHDMAGTDPGLGIGLSIGPLQAFGVTGTPSPAMYYKVKAYEFEVACNPQTGRPTRIGNYNCDDSNGGESGDASTTWCP
jgi:hypothetical protein